MDGAPVEFRPEDPAYIADPFPLLAQLRTHDPVHWSPRLKAWIVTRYADVKTVLTTSGMSSDRVRPFIAALPAEDAGRIETLSRYLSLWMVFRDPPEHTRLRRLTGKVFSVPAMQAMRARIKTLIASLLDDLEGRREIDFIADFAGPLPALVIMTMLGVPREELARIKRLSDEMALFIGSSRMSAAKYAVAEAAAREMAGLFRELIEERCATPQDDVLSALVALRDGDDRLTEDELVATCMILLFAGHETTTNHLGNGLLSLLRFPQQLQRLRDEPPLANRAVEELLRYDGPSGAQVRIVQQPAELAGKALSPGERVFVMLNAANRDPAAYPDPDTLDLDRDGVPHLTFGYGPHLCLGFALARLEGQLAFPAVLARWRHIELAAPEARIEWLNSMVFRGMKALPVRLDG